MSGTLARMLRSGRAYSLSMKLLGVHNYRSIIVNNYIRPGDGDKILDIGCGPGDIVQYLPHVSYVGFDNNRDYIEQAKQKFGQRGLFIWSSINTYSVKEADQNTYDAAIALGVLHHVNDTEATTMFNIARTALKPGGRLITLDNRHTDNQPQLEKVLLSLDRGKFIRTPEGYRDLALRYFGNVKVFTETNMLRVPYSHTILECHS
jgi:cyclopropane fatty-acyl-phospholipid synthase-like methyltransferase